MPVMRLPRVTRDSLEDTPGGAGRPAQKDDLASTIQVAQAVAALREEGPAVGRPLVDRIQGGRIHHLKEPQPGSAARSEIGCSSRICMHRLAYSLMISQPGRASAAIAAQPCYASGRNPGTEHRSDGSGRQRPVPSRARLLASGSLRGFAIDAGREAAAELTGTARPG
jgi:hypothetical protein